MNEERQHTVNLRVLRTALLKRSLRDQRTVLYAVLADGMEKSYLEEYPYSPVNFQMLCTEEEIPFPSSSLLSDWKKAGKSHMPQASVMFNWIDDSLIWLELQASRRHGLQSIMFILSYLACLHGKDDERSNFQERPWKSPSVSVEKGAGKSHLQDWLVRLWKSHSISVDDMKCIGNFLSHDWSVSFELAWRAALKDHSSSSKALSFMPWFFEQAHPQNLQALRVSFLENVARVMLETGNMGMLSESLEQCGLQISTALRIILQAKVPGHQKDRIIVSFNESMVGIFSSMTTPEWAAFREIIRQLRNGPIQKKKKSRNRQLNFTSGYILANLLEGDVVTRVERMRRLENHLEEPLAPAPSMSL